MSSAPLTILGIDPGLRCCGWGVIRQTGSHLAGIACGVIQPPEKAPMAQRLAALASGITALIAEWQPPEGQYEAALEEVFVNINAQSTLKLGLARGAALAALGQAGLTVGEYAPSQLKQCVTGYGRADKAQMTAMVTRLLPGLVIPKHDAADALAVAIAHAQLRTHAALLARTAAAR